MKIYKTEDEQIIKASSNLEIVNQLKNGGRFTADETPTEYIEGFAERMEEYDGRQIRSDSIDNFIEDLIECNYLTEINALQK